MKNILLASSLIVLGMSSAFAADGTITINGNVTASTCVINSGTPDFVVTLPTVSTTVLDTANDTAGRTPFTINLTECSAATKVATYFEPGSTVDFATGRLNNTTGDATNVQVQLLGSNTTAIPVFAVGSNGSQAGSQIVTTDVTGAAALDYYAEYFATGAAGAGTVNTSVQYTIVYP